VSGDMNILWLNISYVHAIMLITFNTWNDSHRFARALD
jgi:hypothetical protein